MEVWGTWCFFLYTKHVRRRAAGGPETLRGNKKERLLRVRFLRTRNGGIVDGGRDL